MTLVSLSIIDKFGRKLLLLISLLLMAICYAVLGVFYLIKVQDQDLAMKISWLPLISIAVYISAFSIGCGPVPWVLMGEIYSSEVSVCLLFLKLIIVVFFFILIYNVLNLML